MTSGDIAKIAECRAWLDPTTPQPPFVYGMLDPCEAMMYFHLAKDAFRGEGAIVDGGSFLGRSTSYLASGLIANPVQTSQKVHCFDLFRVPDALTSNFLREYLKSHMAIGDSTRALFDTHVDPFAHMLEVYEGDLNAIHWTARPIELLVVDIAKDRKLNGRVADLFYRNLIPGKSAVIHQDYHHPALPHIHVTMEYLADCFELVIPRVDSSAVFHCRTAIPEDKLDRVIRYDFSSDEEISLLDRAISRLAPQDSWTVRLARMIVRRDVAPRSTLLRELDDLQRGFSACDLEYHHQDYFFGYVRGLIESMS